MPSLRWVPLAVLTGAKQLLSSKLLSQNRTCPGRTILYESCSFYTIRRQTTRLSSFFFFSILGLFIYRVSVIFKSDQRLPKRECFRYFQRSTVTDKTVISCMQMLVSCLQTMEDDGGYTGPIAFHSNRDEVLSATKQSFS